MNLPCVLLRGGKIIINNFRLLAELKLQPTLIDTHGYEKLLEVMGQTCNDSWQLFLDLQNYNPYAPKMRKDLDDSIAAINRALSERKM